MGYSAFNAAENNLMAIDNREKALEMLDQHWERISNSCWEIIAEKWSVTNAELAHILREKSERR